MNTKIYHCNLRDFPEYGTEQEKIEFALNKENYKIVANLWLNSNLQNAKDDAYKLTQNGYLEEHPSWVEFAKSYENNVLYVNQARSTSVGDIIELNDSKYLVNSVGFQYLKEA